MTCKTYVLVSWERYKPPIVSLGLLFIESCEYKLPNDLSLEL